MRTDHQKADHPLLTMRPRVDQAEGEAAIRTLTSATVTGSPRGSQPLAPTSTPELHRLIGMEVGPDVTAGDLIRVAIARSVVDLLHNLPVAREDRDPEGVHQARVAIRRIRSNLQTFEPVLDRDWAVTLRSDLEPLGFDLGRVRDDDVLDCRLMRLAQTHPEIVNEHITQMRSVLAAQRLRDRRELIARLDDAPTDRLLGRLVAEAADLPVGPGGDTPATSLLVPVLRKRWRKLEKAVATLPVSPELDDLHRVRILTKRVRYAAEAVAPAYGRKAGRFAKAAATLQDDLGELNDAAVARAWLSDVSPLLTRPAAFAAGRLSQQIAVESRDRARAWRKTYRSLEKRYEAWLG